MICKDLTRYIDAFLDDELSVVENLRLQAHLALCGNCRAIVKTEATLRNLTEADALQDRAPEHLREKILRKIGEQPQPKPSRSFEPFTFPRRVFLAGLAVGLVVVGLIVSLTSHFLKDSPVSDSTLVAEMVEEHRRYSHGEGNLKVRSSDPLEVGSWLRTELKYPVRLPLLARPGEKLLGARLFSIAHRQAGYLLYERAGRRVSLYVFKTDSGLFPQTSPESVAGIRFFASTVEGLPVAWWEDQDIYYAAVSDGGIDDLIEFGLLCVKGKQV